MDNNTETAELPLITQPPATPEAPPPGQAQSEPFHPFVCKECGKGFDKLNAVKMHHLRVHTPGGGRGYAWKKRRPPARSREELLARKNESNRRQREKFYAQGLDSRGRPRPPGFKPRKRHVHGGAVPIGSNLPGWSPERRAKFLRTQRRKAREKAMSKAGAQMFEAGGKHDNNHAPPLPSASVMFCPRCGCNVEVVRKAIEFADRQ